MRSPSRIVLAWTATLVLGTVGFAPAAMGQAFTISDGQTFLARTSPSSYDTSPTVDFRVNGVAGGLYGWPLAFISR